MELRRTPTRRAGLTALAALLVFGASACSGGTGLVGTPPAATVNGTTISQADVTEATEATRRFYEGSIEQGQDSDGSLAALAEQLGGGTEHAVGTEGAAQVLSDMIADQIIHDALAEADALPSKQDEKDIRSSLEQQIGADELKKIDAGYLDLYIERKALNDAFTRWAAGQDGEGRRQAYFDENLGGGPLCLNAIQAQTEADAAAAKARVDGGEDFVAVAQSVAPQAGISDTGAIACVTTDQAQQVFGEDFTAVEPGDIVGPVPYTSAQGGEPVYFVLRVEQTDGYTLEEAKDILDANVPEELTEEEVGTYDASDVLRKEFEAADVQVNPLFGRWSDAESRVVPPNVPGTTTTTTIPVTELTGS